MTFKDIQEFFKSWGLYPALESTDEYNSDSIFVGLNQACVKKFFKEAKELFGKDTVGFFHTQISTRDNSSFLRAYEWVDMEKAYNKFNS